MGKRIIITNEDEYNKIATYLRNGELNDDLNYHEKYIIRRKTKNMALINNRIHIKTITGEFLEYLTDFDAQRKESLINETHLRSHRGISSLFIELSKKYYNIKKEDIKNVLDNCVVCSRRIVLTEVKNITPIIILNKFDRFMIDITYMNEYTQNNNGFQYILNIVDCNSKFAWSNPCLTKSSNEVYLHLESLFLNCYIPKELHSDNGLEFRNSKIASLCQRFNVRQVFGRPYHPESQGQVERFNFTMKRMLLSVMFNQNTDKWVELLSGIIYEYNIKYNRAINKSPVQELLGYNGFNVTSNLYLSSETPLLINLSEEEIQEIDDFRIRYFVELSQVTRKKIIRRGNNVPELNRGDDYDVQNE